MKQFARFAAGLALACFSQLAMAGLLGTTVSQCANSAYTGVVSVDVSACDPGTAQPVPSSATVDGGVEFNLADNRFFDFGDNTLRISYVQPVFSASPDLLIFTLEQTVTGVSLLGANPLAVSWTFMDNRLGILIAQPLIDGTVLLQIDAAGAAVPEPGTIGLAMLAMLGLAASVARRRQNWK